MKLFKQILFFFGVLLFFSCTKSKVEISKKKYQSAVSFMYANYNNKTAFNLSTDVNWFDDKSGIWFIDYSKNKKIYKTVNFEDYIVKELFNYNKLVAAITNLTGSVSEENEVSFSNFQPTEKGLSFNYSTEKYTVNLNTYELKKEEKKEQDEPNNFESTSPNGFWIAYVKNYNLFVKSTKTNNAYQLSFNGKKGYEYASGYGWFDKMKGENGARPKHFFISWSKDSKWISTNIVDTRKAEKMYLLDWSKDKVYKPELLSYYRGSPGDSTMVKLKPVFFNMATKKPVQSGLPTQTHVNSVSSIWMRKSGVLLAQIPYRGFKKTEILQVDLNTQKSKTLILETSKTNIDNFEYRFLEKTQKIVFLSERSGWRQMYLLDIETNQTNLITSDGYFINKIEFIDEENETIYFLASGKEADNNPYHQQLYKVNFKGKEQLLTSEMKHHQIGFSKDGKYFSDNISTINSPTKTVLREAVSGKILAELTKADISDAQNRGYTTPETFSLIAKDTETIIYGALWKPTNFDDSKKYPIIDATYTGPHTQVFPKSFDRVFSLQSLAELGFIVVRIDGLGTSGRSKKFHNYSYKNMGNNLEDHILAIKYLANKYSWIAVDKVGIYGHSAGGYDTGRAMLAFPDFYKVGVASSADHDFRMEKAWWPEMYQGWPVDETYEEVSNITNAANLKGKLLLVHGGLDDNVNPSATFKLAEELIKADKDFDLLILPSQRHGYTGKHRNYFIKKRWNYFIEHLLETKPIWDFKWK
jgi:dipeptidyl aminopeptidase/acylaminoacyl peptidase